MINKRDVIDAVYAHCANIDINSIDLLKKIISFIDLTNLNDNESEEGINNLCIQGQTDLGDVAAICVYPRFIPLVRSKLQHSSIRVATVVNFPYGCDDVQETVSMIKQAIRNGADEIDAVFPYKDYLDGFRNQAVNFVERCKEACGEKILLKVIIESGVLNDDDLIYRICVDVIQAGADFIKTSTGKVGSGATIEAAFVILNAIHTLYQTGETKKPIGFKVSGGIKTIDQAIKYLYMTEYILEQHPIQSNLFRFGSSSLINDILHRAHNVESML